jgi:hypothetical protein
LRILLINWQDRENPQAGGAEIHLHEIFGRLAAAGHDVTLLCGGWPGCAPRATLDGIRVHRVGTRQTFALLARRAFRRAFRPDDFDVLVEDINKVPLFTRGWGVPTHRGARAAPVRRDGVPGALVASRGRRSGRPSGRCPAATAGCRSRRSARARPTTSSGAASGATWCA